MAEKKYDISPQVILDAKATTGVGTTLDVREFDNVVIKLWTASSADLTVKIQGSIDQVAPTFTATQTFANHWTYIESFDMATTATAKAGATGYVFTGTDSGFLIQVNTEHLAWLNMNVTARAAGNVSASAVRTCNP